MAALHAASTRLASAHVDVKPPDDRAHHRQLFLVLRGDGCLLHHASTVWALPRYWRVVGFIDLRRHRAMRFPPIRPTGFTAGALGIGRQRLREGRGLSEPRAARVVQLPFQMIDLLAQPIIFPLHAIVLALRVIAFALGALCTLPPALNLRCRPSVGRRIPGIRHALVMPESPPKYKSARTARGQDPLTRYKQFRLAPGAGAPRSSAIAPFISLTRSVRTTSPSLKRLAAGRAVDQDLLQRRSCRRRAAAAGVGAR